MLRKMTVVLLLFLPCAVFAQEAPNAVVWKPFRYFVGSWKGTSEGQPGTGQVEERFEFILNGKFLMVSGKSAYAPQRANIKGQVYAG